MSEVVSPSSAPSSVPQTTRSRWRIGDGVACLVIVACLCGHVAVGFYTAKSLSVTNDEYWHLPVGILNLRTRRFEYEPLNPPLTRMVAASAVTAMEPGCYQGPVPVSPEATSYGLHYLKLMGDRHQPSYLGGRVANLLFSVLTGVFLAIWSWQWWGRTAGCLAVLLWSAEPTVLAHASLVTPDAGLTCLTCALWYALWCYFQRPKISRALICGLLLGLAQLTKFTAVILAPLAIVVWLLWMWKRQPADSIPSRRATAWHLAAVLATCLLIVNLGYGFQGTFGTLNQIQPRSAMIVNLIRAVPVVGAVPLPLPQPYLAGLDAQKHVLESQHAVYLDGTWVANGFWFYFFWALLYKLPHIWQLLCGLGFVRAAWSWRDRLWNYRIGFIAVPLISLLLIANLSKAQLGIRYVLPVYPFLCLLAASVFAQTASFMLARARYLLIFAAIVLAPLSLRFHPQHLSYFNELAGGPAGGAEHLLDSNLDWGQDLLQLKAYIEKQPDPVWLIAYFGSVPPGELGLKYQLPPPDKPLPGTYAVSVNYAYGRPHVILDQTGKAEGTMVNEFSYLRAFKPVKKIGASILIYRLNASDVAWWNSP